MITAEWHDRVALVTVDRAERRNALDVEHCVTLHETVAAQVEKGARAVVVTGSGTSFCAGADLDGVYGPQFRDALYRLLYGLAELPVPVVAAVNGPAVGAGTQLAIACDLRVATDNAFFAVPTARNGLAVDPWTVRRLALLAGGGAARAMLLGADKVSASLAHQRGLVDRIGSTQDALDWAADIATMAPLSLRYSKLALDPSTVDSVLDAEFLGCWDSEDVAEGQRARAQKRQPEFRGR